MSGGLGGGSTELYASAEERAWAGLAPVSLAEVRSKKLSCLDAGLPRKEYCLPGSEPALLRLYATNVVAPRRSGCAVGWWAETVCGEGRRRAGQAGVGEADRRQLRRRGGKAGSCERMSGEERSVGRERVESSEESRGEGGSHRVSEEGARTERGRSTVADAHTQTALFTRPARLSSCDAT